MIIRNSGNAEYSALVRVFSTQTRCKRLIAAAAFEGELIVHI
jgi:hypothetical protein